MENTNEHIIGTKYEHFIIGRFQLYFTKSVIRLLICYYPVISLLDIRKVKGTRVTF